MERTEGTGGRAEFKTVEGKPNGHEKMPRDDSPPATTTTIQDLIASLNELRHEISYAKYNNNDWWHSTLKRLDTQNQRIHRLTGFVIWTGWLILLLTIAVIGLLVFNGVLRWPSWEEISQLWHWAK